MGFFKCLQFFWKNFYKKWENFIWLRKYIIWEDKLGYLEGGNLKIFNKKEIIIGIAILLLIIGGGTYAFINLRNNSYI